MQQTLCHIQTWKVLRRNFQSKSPPLDLKDSGASAHHHAFRNPIHDVGIACLSQAYTLYRCKICMRASCPRVSWGTIKHAKTEMWEPTKTCPATMLKALSGTSLLVTSQLVCNLAPCISSNVKWWYIGKCLWQTVLRSIYFTVTLFKGSADSESNRFSVRFCLTRCRPSQCPQCNSLWCRYPWRNPSVMTCVLSLLEYTRTESTSRTIRLSNMEFRSSYALTPHTSDTRKHVSLSTLPSALLWMCCETAADSVLNWLRHVPAWEFLILSA